MVGIPSLAYVMTGYNRVMTDAATTCPIDQELLDILICPHCQSALYGDRRSFVAILPVGAAIV